MTRKHFTFNSIKVQLSLYQSLEKYVSYHFQFHKGTIKPVNGVAAPSAGSVFQFHKGTIKPATISSVISGSILSIP